MNAYEKLAVGGMIYLYITRITIDAANTDNFTVIVKDSTDNNEIFRKQLKSNIAETPSSGDSQYWWNYTSVPISEKIQGKFYIYIIDRLGDENNKRFKFEVKL
jgi:hypothetical protein